MYTRHPRALIPRLIEPLRIHRTLESVSLAAIGLENQVRAAFDVGASPASAQVRSWDVATMGESCRFRHRHAGRRCTSIPPASGVMTESACGSSTRCAPARCSPASVRATMRLHGAFRALCRTHVNARRANFNSAAVQ